MKTTKPTRSLAEVRDAIERLEGTLELEYEVLESVPYDRFKRREIWQRIDDLKYKLFQFRAEKGRLFPDPWETVEESSAGE